MTIAVSGYASLDRAMLADGLAGSDETVIVRRRLSSSWPSPGGAAYVARATAEAGAPTALVTWIGSDPDGDSYLADLSEHGIDPAGVDRSAGRSPAAWLFYDADGHAACYFDPGEVANTLTDPQRELLHSSPWWALAVGPPAVTEAVLDSIGDETKLAWIVKADTEAFPPALAARLLRRSDVITHNRGEREFLARMTGSRQPFEHLRPDAVVIETSGRGDVEYRGPSGCGSVSTDPLPATDTTGAGDTLAGTVIAALAQGATAQEATEAGVQVAHQFLTARLDLPHE